MIPQDKRMSDWMRKVLESKRAMRQHLATLSFSESRVRRDAAVVCGNLRILEELRNRSLAIAASPLRQEQTRKP